MGNSNSLLKLTKSQVNDVITQIEENSPRLTLVEISYCPSLGKRHLEKLTEGLKRNTHVQQLCLYGNNLGDKGAIMLADALMENGHIQDVALGSNNIGDTGLSALTEILGTNSSIRTLDLVYNKIGNEGASLLAGVLSKHDALQAVNLGHNKIGNHGASALAFALRENKSLQAIYMNANKIDDQGVQAFIETLHDCNTTLINVSLKENLSVNLDKLARLEGLCERNRGGDSSDAETDKKKKFQDILEKVRQDDPDLSFVDLSYNSSTMGEFSALTKALKQNTHVQQLILYGDNIGDEGAAMLAESLKENQHLGMVILGFANIGDEGASSLAEVLRMNTSVQTLDLVYNKIGDDGASSLAQVLTANKTLQGINLGHNKIGNTGAFALAHALRENQSIRALHLRSNEIDDDEAVQAFADSLSDYNTTLTTISLENNRVNIGERLSRIAELCERNRNQPSSETKGIPESRLAAGSTKANMNVSSCATSKGKEITKFWFFHSSWWTVRLKHTAIDPTDASSKSSAPKTIRQNTSALAKARAFVESEARAEKVRCS